MGLGGYLTWTALAREIKEKHGIRTIPLELHGGATKLIKSPIFYNNPNFVQEFDNNFGVQVVLNNPNANYCIQDTRDKAYHKSDSHIIETVCSAYNISNPKLRCEIYLDRDEQIKVNEIVNSLPENYITIEPKSNFEYTVNRKYPFEKWQKVVNDLSGKINFVQIGIKDDSLPLENVIDLRGKTTFRTSGGVIGRSKLLLSSEGGLTHLATAFNTPAVVVLTGYQSLKMVEYPQNFYIDISNHGPCGMKTPCLECKEDRNNHDYREIVSMVENIIG